MLMISIHTDEAGENTARIIEVDGEVVVSMDTFIEGVVVPPDAEVVEIGGRYKLYVVRRDRPEGRIEFLVYDNGTKRQLISARYIGSIRGEDAVKLLKGLLDAIAKTYDLSKI
ncbi:conserved hypothetical protein [Thermoproteus tenax Kra 1]|uniref:Uncharacterized protein n=2 Tax=Thermoproteus tenax TaxID=2271 RepID=G4RPL2_THETK|nr:conserved hypothetical protein [Thermoproteus tenax Kra 1]